MSEIMIRVSTVFAMIMIGYAACKGKLIRGEAQVHLAALLLNINIPCMLLVSITGNELNAALLRSTVQMLALSGAYFAAAALMIRGLLRVFRIRSIDPYRRGVYQAVFISTNAGFFGFPVTQMIFGDEALYYMVLLNIVMNLYLYSICPLQLGGMRLREGISRKNLSKLLNPCILSAVISILLLFAHVHLPDYLVSVLKPIGDATIPLAMILIGIQLAGQRVCSYLQDRQLLLVCLIRMIFWPGLVFLCLRWTPLPAFVRVVLVLGAALPPASTISVLALGAGGDDELAAGGIVITTLLTCFSIPLCTVLMGMGG
ncbi:MAG: AEC family transporter [Firmicutes bacterium]|nr:AEC family transporter [Bacillota bacterium]